MSIKFYDATNGIIVGDSGRILLTTDSGDSWSATIYGTENLREVDYASSAVLYAVGTNRTIIKSDNGGGSWTAIFTGGAELTAVDFYDENIGYAGSYQEILMTRNGGSTWTSYLPSEDGEIRDIFVIDAQNVLATSSTGNIYRSYNHGLTWFIETATATFDLNFDVNSVSLSPALDQVWLGTADSRIYNFDVSGTPYQPQAIVQSITIDVSTIPDIPNAIFVIDDTLNGETIDYFLSNDGGLNWIKAQNFKKTTFLSTGSDLMWKAELRSDGDTTPTIEGCAYLLHSESIAESAGGRAINLSTRRLRSGDFLLHRRLMSEVLILKMMICIFELKSPRTLIFRKWLTYMINRNRALDGLKLIATRLQMTPP